MTRIVATATNLIAVLALLAVVPVAGAATPKKFHNCAAVDAVYPHGIAKSFKVIKTADGLTGRPFVSAALYARTTKVLDRDHDGVMCET
jgi:hypothetical protein